MIVVEKLDNFMIFYPDNILIYTNRADHADTIWYVFDQLKKYFLYIHLKKYRFYREEVWFLDYIVSLRGICMEDE